MTRKLESKKPGRLEALELRSGEKVVDIAEFRRGRGIEIEVPKTTDLESVRGALIGDFAVLMYGDSRKGITAKTVDTSDLEREKTWSGSRLEKLLGGEPSKFTDDAVLMAAAESATRSKKAEERKKKGTKKSDKKKGKKKRKTNTSPTLVTGIDEQTLRKVHRELARDFAPDDPTILSVIRGVEERLQVSLYDAELPPGLEREWQDLTRSGFARDLRTLGLPYQGMKGRGHRVPNRERARNGRRGARCEKGQLKVSRKGYTRKGYTTKDGTRVPVTRVPPSVYCIDDRGEPGRGKDIVPGGVERGGLYGYHVADSETKRRKCLRTCIKKDGYSKCRHRLQYLLVVGKNEWTKKQLATVRKDLDYLVRNYGGGKKDRKPNATVDSAEAKRLKNALISM